MEKLKTDLLIIGAGPGGYVAAIYAKKQGLDVVLVDKEWVGGTCLNVGCIPTKAFVRSAEMYHDLLNEDLGITFDALNIDLNKVVDKKNAIKEKLVSGIEFLLNKHGVKVIQGQAKFVSDNLVLVNDQEIQAKNMIIATGSQPKHLPIKGADLMLSSRQLLDNRKLPKSLTVIGGGIIGMEFAFIYANMGVTVNVVEFLPRILPGIDKELALRLIPYAKKAGINILTKAKVVRVEEANQLKKVYFERKDKEDFVESEMVLEAIGRAPQVKGLALEQTSLDYDDFKGINVNSHMKTNLEHIYAIGDVNNIMQLAHVASHQAFVAVDNILGKQSTFDKTNVPSVIFTSPTIATVGITEEMAKEKNIDVDIIKVPFSANGKALILNGDKGYIKLIRNKETKKLIGAMILGKEAENLIATYTLAIENQLKAENVHHTIFAHPTIQELVHESALGLDQLAIHYME
ncbi:dihydrolipoyl dehydrogenase [Mycoplasmatota bacterium]|nr:dihydrolipoyl dehydrogenase [Mycoplasmatota bacterium]